ncbi:Cobalt transport protein CbiN [Nostocoides australiense Ben110]|uniref:Cobalt transport protein CbiN n=1 Tax=Nostocoides australiense Ben110 TaxID=1193182 RepID=W6K4Q7_9MICO|nr:cobalt transport protein CbiN [Tetrasphaera australiensis]CCH75434.1 Cobalt transport protein CbiN [Tetrasphaera australiensis Ben110]
MRRATTWLIVLVIIAVLGGMYLVGSRTGPGTFTGTDSVARSAIESSGYRPWAHSVFKPASPDIESGLFAAQALVGGLILGYAVGSLRAGARRQRPSGPAVLSESIEPQP